MPIYEYSCDKCGEVTELLVMSKQETPKCKGCGSEDLKKLMSAHNTHAGSASFSAPACGSCCESPAMCGGTPGGCCAH